MKKNPAPQKHASAPDLQRDGIGVGAILRRAENGAFEYVRDELAAEEPLEIRVNNDALVVTMRTPGHDEELAAGLLFTEAVVRSRADVRNLAHCELAASRGNVLNVTLSPNAKPDGERLARRFGAISASCGVCGKTSIAAIRQHFPPISFAPEIRIAADTILDLPKRIESEQENFSHTGGIHAAALFTVDGKLFCAREDIGRHNAVDKVIGRAFLDGVLPLRSHVLMVSGRASFEIVQKALAAGIPIIASVSAPSTLAADFARENGQTLIGFLRPPTFNIYSHIERVIFDESQQPGTAS